MHPGHHRRRELLAIADGYRESAQSWSCDLKRRGLEVAPELAVGDGALGFWKALRESHGTTREQRCWLHKTGNVLNKLPKSLKGHRRTSGWPRPRIGREADFFDGGLRRQVRQGHGLPGQGPRAAHLLPTSGSTCADQSHRKHLVEDQDQGLSAGPRRSPAVFKFASRQPGNGGVPDPPPTPRSSRASNSRTEKS